MRTNWEKQNKLSHISAVLDKNLRKDDILDLFSEVMDWAGSEYLTLTEKIQAVDGFQDHPETPHIECCGDAMYVRIEKDMSINLACPKCRRIRKVPEVVYEIYRNGDLL